MGGGQGVCQTDDVGQGGVQKVSFWSDVFDGWSLSQGYEPMTVHLNLKPRVTQHDCHVQGLTSRDIKMSLRGKDPDDNKTANYTKQLKVFIHRYRPNYDAILKLVTVNVLL